MEDTRTIVGWDVSKSSIMATAVDPQGHRVEQVEIGVDDATLVDFLERLLRMKLVILEACGVWEQVYDAAVSTGRECFCPIRWRPVSSPGPL